MPEGEAAPSSSAGAAPWAALFRGDTAIYTGMVLLGVVLFSVQILIIVTIMPTVVADIGGGSYYVWASMLYQVGAIVGAASIGPVWRAVGMRGGFFVSSAVYVAGTLGCALAPDMLTLNAARLIQGCAGGLITGGTMGLISRVFQPSQRVKMLALYQGVWTVCSLLGPVFGGGFAAIGWWRGAFWFSIPFALVFAFIAWRKVPRERETSRAATRQSVPGLRLALLAAGVAGIAEAGQVTALPLRIAIFAASIICVWGAFHVDARARQRLFPTHPLSVSHAVGLAYWLLIIVGGVQAAVTIFMPLSLQLVHGLSPVWVGLANLAVSIAWTIATFLVSGWSGRRERFALNSGPVLMLLGIVMLLPTAGADFLWLLFVAVFVLGWGIGSHNVHLGARTMDAALPGEEAITASSQSMVRSLGGAIGTAAAGLVANVAGLGDATAIESVNSAVFAVYLAALAPMAIGVLFIFRFTQRAVPQSVPARRMTA